jgi:hypothetical protein
MEAFRASQRDACVRILAVAQEGPRRHRTWLLAFLLEVGMPDVRAAAARLAHGGERRLLRALLERDPGGPDGAAEWNREPWRRGPTSLEIVGRPTGVASADRVLGALELAEGGDIETLASLLASALEDAHDPSASALLDVWGRRGIRPEDLEAALQEDLAGVLRPRDLGLTAADAVHLLWAEAWSRWDAAHHPSVVAASLSWSHSRALAEEALLDALAAPAGPLRDQAALLAPLLPTTAVVEAVVRTIAGCAEADLPALIIAFENVLGRRLAPADVAASGPRAAVLLLWRTLSGVHQSPGEGLLLP